jgi:glycosyltransferase involved in cell wall biosynthesis
MVDDGETGLLVDSSNPGALAQALDRILSDPELATHLGTAARSRAANRYTTEVHVTSVISVYEDVLGERAV